MQCPLLHMVYMLTSDLDRFGNGCNLKSCFSSFSVTYAAQYRGNIHVLYRGFTGKHGKLGKPDYSLLYTGIPLIVPTNVNQVLSKLM